MGAALCGHALCKDERPALLAGLDPYAGFVHVDRAGQPSLALDLIEEFRQMVADRTIFFKEQPPDPWIGY